MRNRCRRRGGRSHGVILIWVMVALVALCGIVSLAVDYGRVQLVRAQLQNAADAAARYAVTGLGDGTAISKAISAAHDNSADGSPVVITAADIVAGNWDQSQTPKFSTTRTPVNAIQITASRTAAKGNAIPLVFGAVAKVPTCDVTARALVMLEQGLPGFAGLNGITVKNNAFIASYDSSTTTNPNSSNAKGAGSIGSNGPIEGKNNNTLRGKVTLGPDGDVTGFDVTGATTTLPQPMVAPQMPEWAPSSNPGGLPQSYTVSSATVLSGGTYWFTALTINAPLSFSGPAKVIVNGNIVVDSSLTASGKSPKNLVVYQLGSGRSFGDDSNNMDLTAVIIAPGADFIAKNNFTARGSFLFNTITAKNNFEMYYDEALNDGSAGALSAPVISMVQ